MSPLALNPEKASLSAKMLAERRADWKAFTKGLAVNGVAVAGLLLVLLIVFRVF